MTTQILFIHGAGGYQDDQTLITDLKETLGNTYHIVYPKMPGTSYASWKRKLDAELGIVANKCVLVGHSLGASVLLKYVGEEKIKRQIIGVFLLAAPFWGTQNWEVDEFVLADNFTDMLPKNIPLYFYHNRDDTVVPFDHMTRYKDLLPEATVRTYKSGGHQFEQGVFEVAQDIKNLSGEQYS